MCQTSLMCHLRSSWPHLTLESLATFSAPASVAGMCPAFLVSPHRTQKAPVTCLPQGLPVAAEVWEASGLAPSLLIHYLKCKVVGEKLICGGPNICSVGEGSQGGRFPVMSLTAPQDWAFSCWYPVAAGSVCILLCLLSSLPCLVSFFHTPVFNRCQGTHHVNFHLRSGFWGTWTRTKKPHS